MAKKRRHQARPTKEQIKGKQIPPEQQTGTCFSGPKAALENKAVRKLYAHNNMVILSVSLLQLCLPHGFCCQQALLRTGEKKRKRLKNKIKDSMYLCAYMYIFTEHTHTHIHTHTHTQKKNEASIVREAALKCRVSTAEQLTLVSVGLYINSSHQNPSLQRSHQGVLFHRKRKQDRSIEGSCWNHIFTYFVQDPNLLYPRRHNIYFNKLLRCIQRSNHPLKLCSCFAVVQLQILRQLQFHEDRTAS